MGANEKLGAAIHGADLSEAHAIIRDLVDPDLADHQFTSGGIMSLQPYMGHTYPGRLKRPGPLPLDTLEYRMRAAVIDDGGLLVDGAEAIADLRKQLDAADARVKGLEAELIANRALTRETVA